MKKIISTLRTCAWAIGLLMKAAPVEMALVTFFMLLQGLIPAAALSAIQGIIGWISTQGDFPTVYVVLWGVMLFTDVVLSPISSVVRLQLNEKILSVCNIYLMEKANGYQGLKLFEDAKLYDEVQFLKNEAAKRPLNLIYVVTGFMKEGIALLSVLVVLSTLGWWIPLALFCAACPHAFSTYWFEKKAWDQVLFRHPEARKLAWLSSLTLNDQTAKEVRLFGFGDFLVQRYRETAKTMHDLLSKERLKKSFSSLILSSLTVIGNILIISVVILKAKAQAFQIGGLVIAIQSLTMTQSHLSGCIAYLGMSTPVILFFEKLHDFLSSKSNNFSEQVSDTLPQFNHEISFENVSFNYPDGRKALTNLSFKISKGEKIAIVGQNGAGKSTLVKLLLRFYDPTEGAIKVDGKDLKTLDISAWRSKLSGVFQDFGHYNFTVNDNISLGDVKASPERVSLAAKKGGFSPIIKRLPQGLNTYLGKEFGGTTLSGGEWQKLAMSRAFLREADILVLDEPTSSLDPKSECAVFNQFSVAIQGKTAIFITHRLGSVKMADRIFVLKEGQLIEEGTPQDLLKIQGEYAYLFKLQANQYELHSLVENTNV